MRENGVSKPEVAIGAAAELAYPANLRTLLVSAKMDGINHRLFGGNSLDTKSYYGSNADSRCRR
jgi:hypothetical protein